MFLIAFGLVEGPEVGGLFLGQNHVLGRIVAAERGNGKDDREDAGYQGDTSGECLAFLFLQLFRIWEFDVCHSFLRRDDAVC